MKERTIAINMEEQLRLLQRENSLLNSIIQGASDSIYAKDQEGKYITINEAGAAYFGLHIDEIIGKTDEELLGSYGEEIMEWDRKLYQTKNPVAYETNNFGLNSNYYATNKSPLYDSNQNLIGLIGISRDISATKLAEEKYKFIFDNAPIGFWEEDFSRVKTYLDELKTSGVKNFRKHFKENPESLKKCISLIRVINVNRATMTMNATDDKSSITSQIRQNFTKGSEKIFLEEFTALAEGRTFYQSEGSILNQKGELLHLIFNLNVLPGSEESLSLVLISVVNVSDSRKMANELTSIKHRYQSIVEAQTGMICRIDPNGKIMFHNMAFTQFFGFKDDGEDVRFVTLFPPEELEKCEKKIETLSARTPANTCELRNYDKDGNLVWQEWSVTAFFGNSGTLLGYQAVGTDVTSRKMAQDALAASEARWRSVFEHADDLIMTVNSEGYILSVNEYSELQKNTKWAGRTFDEVMLPENAREAMKLVNDVFATGNAIKKEFRMVRKNGSYAMYDIALSPIYHGKRVITAICIARNITATKEFEKHNREALIEGEENERMRVSQELHDGLGQLFTAIKLNLQQLKTGVENGSDKIVLDGIEILEENIGVAITEVKNISRNLMPDVLWQFGLKPAIEDLVEKWNTTAEQKISLQLIDLDQRFLEELEKALFRMCQELLNNSIRHGKASNIYVQVINHGESLVLMVEDDGIGFDPHKMPNGFGMRNIRSRAEVFEGTVEIDSAEKRGTVTTIEIPLTNALKQ